MLDKRAVMYYINCQDSARFQSLCTVTKVVELVHLLSDRNISSLSMRPPECKCKLPEQTLLPISRMEVQRLCIPEHLPDLRYIMVDLFANSYNMKCCLFCTKAGYGHNSLRDAMITPCLRTFLYAYSPILLILKNCLKLCSEGARAILIPLAWPGQVWSSNFIHHSELTQGPSSFPTPPPWIWENDTSVALKHRVNLFR